MPVQIDFLVVSSYGNAKVSSGAVELFHNTGARLKDRHVVLVEDIVDSGNTLKRIVPHLLDMGPASLELCTLLHKRIVQLPTDVRWVGFDAPPEFLVGYGLDHAEDFRHLPYVGAI